MACFTSGLTILLSELWFYSEAESARLPLLAGIANLVVALQWLRRPGLSRVVVCIVAACTVGTYTWHLIVRFGLGSEYVIQPAMSLLACLSLASLGHRRFE